MSIFELNIVDIELKLLRGRHFLVNDIEIKPFTLGDIEDIGYENYMQSVRFLLITVDDFIDSTDDLEKKMMFKVEKQKLSPFEFYTVIFAETLLEPMLSALALLLKNEDIFFVKQKNYIVLNAIKNKLIYFEDGDLKVDIDGIESGDFEDLKFIDKDGFANICEILKLQNYLKKIDLDKLNPADEKAREIAERLEELKRKVEKKKKAEKVAEKGRDDESQFSDIVSAVASKSNRYDLFNIWQLTMYQLYDEFIRLDMDSNYNFSIRAICAGAEKIDLVHWSSRKQ